jgi:hypothetical protein
VLEQVNRNAAAHAQLAEEFVLLSSTQVAERAKSKSLASNPAALANRWRQEQKVFAVDVDGVQRFPASSSAETAARCRSSPTSWLPSATG